ncbi:uncharacterized protein [Miscanthus floridulus]|uniref:uncharacterized protein n=1 Tax=Miscanthus floridulus TaxID=154761 RepID=UPI00345B1026
MVLMDEGSGLNILYINTLDAMRIPSGFSLPRGSYHAILGRPCYAKFMAIPNYTYLKLKMSGPNGIITISSAFSHAFTCNHEHFELATMVVNSSKLPWLGESSTTAVLDCNKPTSLMAFRPLEETKAVGIDPTDPTKIVWIRTQLPTK